MNTSQSGAAGAGFLHSPSRSDWRRCLSVADAEASSRPTTRSSADADAEAAPHRSAHFANSRPYSGSPSAPTTTTRVGRSAAAGAAASEGAERREQQRNSQVIPNRTE